MIVFEAPERYRGTIEVYDVRSLGWPYDPETPEWRWRCKSRNSQILAQGEGYRRRSGALNAIDAQYSLRMSVASTEECREIFTQDALDTEGPQPLEAQFVLPWRLVVRDRHGDITTTGAVY